jgi:hypothetical protein
MRTEVVRLLNRLLVVTFIESIATICVERGALFLTKDLLHFSDTSNLWLALLVGAPYAIGALSCHTVARRLGEKRLLLLCLTTQITVCAAMGCFLHPVMIFIGSGVLAAACGLKWAVIESYVSAGLDWRQTARVIGLFNISWAIAVPVALIPSGLIISFWHPALFFLPVLISLVSLALLRGLSDSPLHRQLPEPDDQTIAAARRIGGLLTFSRWQMLGSYSLMWILAALTPGIFQDLGYDVRLQTVLAGVLDVVRLLGFLLLYRTMNWHGRFGPLLAAMVLMPLGFAMVLFAPHILALPGGSAGIGTAAALVGEVVFGLSAAVIYYAALYYAMVYTNAAVRGGGWHEGVIGLGFTLGPAAGLLGAAIAPAVGGAGVGMILVLIPLVAGGVLGSLSAFRGTRLAAKE